MGKGKDQSKEVSTMESGKSTLIDFKLLRSKFSTAK